MDYQGRQRQHAGGLLLFITLLPMSNKQTVKYNFSWVWPTYEQRHDQMLVWHGTYGQRLNYCICNQISILMCFRFEASLMCLVRKLRPHTACMCMSASCLDSYILMGVCTYMGVVYRSGAPLCACKHPYSFTLFYDYCHRQMHIMFVQSDSKTKY